MGENTNPIQLLTRPALLFIFLLFSHYVFSQDSTATIKGLVIDSLEQSPLDSCKVTLFTGTTTSTVYSNRLGSFTFKEVKIRDTMLVSFSAKKFQPSERRLTAVGPNTFVDTVYMIPVAELMEEVRIKSRVPAIAMRHDTTEYAVDSFQHEPYAMIGDVLKDLPGIVIDEEGRITHNGKPITEITVNGQVFYNSDGAIALKNLPADIVSRIQVMDHKSKEQAFNDVQTDGETKSLNIRLKPGFQQFGNASAGGGTRNERSGNIMLNGIEDAKQMSVMGGSSTLGRKSFDPSHSPLITSNENAGAHFSNTIIKGLNTNANANYMNNANEQETRSSLQQFIRTDSSFTTALNSSSKLRGSNYSASLNSTFSKDPKLMMNLNVSYAGGKNSSSSFTGSSIMENGIIKTNSERSTGATTDNSSMNLDFSINKRFKKAGRGFTLMVRSSAGDTHSDMQNRSNSTFFTLNQTREELLRQHIVTEGNNRNIGINFYYSENLLKNLRLQLSHNEDLAWAETNKKTFNVDTITKQEQADSSYSNRWSSNNYRTNSNASLAYTNSKFNITGGVNLVTNKSERAIEAKDNILQKQQNISPSLSAMYILSKTQNLRLSFSTLTQHPSIEQLQPIPDNTNPLFLRIGNPELKSSFQQNYNLSYNGIFKDGKNLSGGLSFSPVSNTIVNATYFDEYRKRITQFINVDGVYNARANWNYTRILKSTEKSAHWSSNGNASFGRNVFFDNSSMLFTRNFTLGQNLNFNKMMSGNGTHRLSGNLSFNYQRTISPSNSNGINSRSMYITPRLEWSYILKGVGEVRSSYDATFNSANYKVGSGNNVSYTDHTLMNDVRYNFTKRAGAHSNFSYRYNGRFPASENRNTYLLNFSVFTQVFKNGKGFINFSANDVLNSNKDYSRSFGESYMQEVQLARQKSYYSVFFQYNWSKTSKKPVETQ